MAAHGESNQSDDDSPQILAEAGIGTSPQHHTEDEAVPRDTRTDLEVAFLLVRKFGLVGASPEELAVTVGESGAAAEKLLHEYELVDDSTRSEE
jgi:hypothetical protein